MKKIVYILGLLLLGALVGSLGSYYHFKPANLTQVSELAAEGNSCKLDVKQSSLKKGLEEKTKLSESEIKAATSYLQFKRIKKQILPSGSPGYASQLGVSYDQASKAVDVLANLEQKIGIKNLNRQEKQRYIKIGNTAGTSCEHCCGLSSKDGFADRKGERKCGCAHNIAFSGLSMWMIKNGYSHQEILTEIGKWKAAFFPKQTLTKKLQEMKKENPDVENILKEFPAFLPQMVGGC